MRKGIRLAALMLAVLAIGTCTACGKEQNKKGKKVKDLEFTVVETADVPEQLLDLIEEKKEQPFKLSYSNEEYLYVVVGYGKKETGGYSIKVNDLYLMDHAIYFNTDLLGPVESEEVEYAASYPYIVVKTEYMDETVVFDS